jgi:putative transposase
MPQSLVKILVHMVWSTKDRVRIIAPDFEPQLYGYISGIITNNGGRMLIAGGDADHIHILASIGRIDISELIGDIKRDSSSWIKQQEARYAQFYWQRGYGAFSIGQSQVEAVTKYIRDQKEHHKSQSYKDEFRALCAKYEVEIDERFCWD